MDSVVHFEIPADDLKRAQNFYQKCFGWQVKPWRNSQVGEYWMAMTKTDQNSPGINGGIMPRKMPGHPVTMYMTVNSIEASLALVKKNGGHVIVPKSEIGENMGAFACFMDTEGNMMGVHEVPDVMKTTAKTAAKKTTKPAAKKKAAKKKK